MIFYYLSMLCCCTVLLAAPLHEFSGEAGPFMDDAVFQLALRLGHTVVRKLMEDIPAAHKATVRSPTLTLTSTTETHLDYMVVSLGIPAAPVLKAIGADFTLETCLNHMSEGLQMYEDLLAAVSGRVAAPEKLTELQADLRELLAQVHKMRELSELEPTVPYTTSNLASRLTGDFEVDVATHLVLVQLQTFVQHIFRSLRNISHTKPGLRM
ncbi:hypothetical protein GN956_G1364 [Arapaima gigas]